MKDFDDTERANLPTFDGSRRISEIAVTSPAVAMVGKGKQTIKDIGARFRQMAALKPGSSSIRTVEMIAEILDRLRSGETLTSIHCDSNMPAIGTFWNWREADPALDAAVRQAQAQGAHMLKDITLDIALGGPMSTGDRARDKLAIETIEANVAQRNRAEFGHRVQVDTRTIQITMSKDDCDW